MAAILSYQARRSDTRSNGNASNDPFADERAYAIDLIQRAKRGDRSVTDLQLCAALAALPHLQPAQGTHDDR